MREKCLNAENFQLMFVLLDSIFNLNISKCLEWWGFGEIFLMEINLIWVSLIKHWTSYLSACPLLTKLPGGGAEPPCCVVLCLLCDYLQSYLSRNINTFHSKTGWRQPYSWRFNQWVSVPSWLFHSTARRSARPLPLRGICWRLGSGNTIIISRKN